MRNFALLLLVAVLFALPHAPEVVAQRRRDPGPARAANKPEMCPVAVAAAVRCEAERPACCQREHAVYCCPGGIASCDDCTWDPSHPAAGYILPDSALAFVVVCLIMLLFLGTVLASGVGRHAAWVLEQRRIIQEARARRELRRAEARQYKAELAATAQADADLPDSVACVICCARRIDCALGPCGHVCSCHFCARRLRECPVCRAAVASTYNLPPYLVDRLAGEPADPEAVAAAVTAADDCANDDGEQACVLQDMSSGGVGGEREPCERVPADLTLTWAGPDDDGEDDGDGRRTHLRRRRRRHGEGSDSAAQMGDLYFAESNEAKVEPS